MIYSIVYIIMFSGNYSFDYVPWKLELAIVGAFAAHRGQHFAIHIEYLRHKKRWRVGMVTCVKSGAYFN